jgi:hypothetical protein
MSVVAITPDRDHYITPIKRYLNRRLLFCRDLDWELFLDMDPELVIFLADWTYELMRFVEKCNKHNIPTVLFLDGIIEWKHFFENPKWSYGGNESPYIPVFCDKIFVSGVATYRFLDFFGNQKKCEIVGLPRFDHYFNKQVINSSHKKNKVIGVMSGNTAGYTDNQIKEATELFKDIHSELQNYTEIDVKWRLRKGFEEVLSFKTPNNSDSLVDFFEQVDAIICQPSTVAYEAMLYGLPVALADYGIAPNYMHASWEIHSKSQIRKVVKELVEPTALKLTLQHKLLEDQISFCGNSAELAANVILEMISYNLGRTNKEFPSDISYSLVEKMNLSINTISYNIFHGTKYELSSHSVLTEKLVKAEKRIISLEGEAKQKNPSYWIGKLFMKLYKFFINSK